MASGAPYTGAFQAVIIGDSLERINADLARSFGNELRAAPKAAGFGLVAWLALSGLPLVGLAWAAVPPPKL